VPATSDTWMEVGDEITDLSVAYAESEHDEEVVHGALAKDVEAAKGADGKHF
jgi:NCS1 family nucleobase:cation symporter-1